MIDGIFNNTKVLEKALDGTWTRNEAIAQNIANADTPGYKRKTVAFEEYLKDAMDGSTIDNSSVDNVEIKVGQDNSTLSTRSDGNNVDIESEMASMAKNTIEYETLVQSISSSYKRLASAIKEGR
jgi:flagellar basal-body rod protein FlgB